MNYSALIKKVENAGNEIFWQGRVTSDEISKLENLVKAKLPLSFIKFLEEYGGGGVIGSEISGIESNNAELDYRGTVYGDTIMCRDQYGMPESLIVIYFSDDEVVWCLDTSRIKDEECPVVSYNVFTSKIDGELAETFHEFFVEYLELRGN